jgi:hypothetical protein
MPYDRGAPIDQLRALLTQERYSSVVVHNQCWGAEHFLEYLARRDIAVEAATPAHVSGYLHYRVLCHYRQTKSEALATFWHGAYTTTCRISATILAPLSQVSPAVLG